MNIRISLPSEVSADMAPMLPPVIEPTPEGTKAYADQIWRQQPDISPNSWRVWCGLTLSKLSWLLPATVTVEQLKAVYDAGLNSWWLVLSADTAVVATVQAFVRQYPDVQSGLVLHGVWPLGGTQPHVPPLLHTLPLASLFAVLPEGQNSANHSASNPPESSLESAPENLINFAQVFADLETAVATGRAVTYGLVGESLAVADGLPLQDLWALAQAAAQQVHGRHKRPAWRSIGVPVNPLELSALRLTRHVHTGTRGADAVSTLEWAARAGLGVFVVRPTYSLGVGSLVHPHPLAQQVAECILPRVAPAWQTRPYQALLLNMAASIPGVVGVVLDHTCPPVPQVIKSIQQAGDFADVAAIFGVCASENNPH